MLACAVALMQTPNIYLMAPLVRITTRERYTFGESLSYYLKRFLRAVSGYRGKSGLITALTIYVGESK